MDDFDLDNFATTETPQDMVLTHPGTGAELTAGGAPIVFRIWAPDSARMRGFERNLQDKRLKAAQTSGRLNLDAASVEQELIARSAQAIAGWSGNFRQGGKPVKYSPEEARRIAREIPWIRDQVNTFYQNRGNFLTGAAGTSCATPPAPSSS